MKMYFKRRKKYLITVIVIFILRTSSAMAQQAFSISNQFYDNELHIAEKLVPEKMSYQTFESIEEMSSKLSYPVIYDSLPAFHSYLVRVGFNNPDYYLLVKQKTEYTLILLKQFAGYSLPAFNQSRLDMDQQNFVVIVGHTASDEKKTDSTGMIGIFTYETDKMIVLDPLKKSVVLDQVVWTVETITRENNNDFSQTNHLEMNCSIK